MRLNIYYEMIIIILFKSLIGNEFYSNCTVGKGIWFTNKINRSPNDYLSLIIGSY